MSKAKPSLVIIEAGHLSKHAVAGGDLLMQEMASYLKGHYSLKIIVPKMAAHHWKEKKGISFYTIPPVYFEKNTSSVFVFLTYLWRIMYVFLYLVRKKGKFIIYSSTNIFADVFPAFFTCILRQKLPWIARIHHLIDLSPNRDRNPLVAIVSYLMQSFVLFMIRDNADVIIVLNETLRRELLKRGFPRKRLEVLGAGIDIKTIGNQRMLRDIPFYDGIFVGRLHPAKGIFDLVPIWTNVTNTLPHARLAIVGEVHMHIKKTLLNLIREEGLKNNIFILGYLSKSTLYGLMKKTKVFLFTDHEAGWGLAAAEAMACGLPVVGWDIGILGSVFKKGFISVPPYDTSRFGKSILSILGNDKRLLQLSYLARKEASKLDWERTSKRFLLILQEYFESIPLK